MERESRLALAPDPSSVGEARRFLRTNLERWRADAFEEVGSLLLSEVMTNVVLHARTASELVVGFRDDRLRVEVHDGSPRLPQEKRYGTSATTGRGLGLLQALSARWGAERTETGKYVWFVLDASAVVDAAPSTTEASFFDVDLAELEELEAMLGEPAPGGSGEDDGTEGGRRVRCRLLAGVR